MADKAIVKVAMDGHPLALLPALNRGHVAVEVGGNFLPRIKSVSGCFHFSQCTWGLFAHSALRLVAVCPEL